MKIKKIHYFSGLIICVFIVLHLYNHASSILGADQHIEVMESLRPIYRNRVVEGILLLAIIIQMISGVNFFLIKRKAAHSKFDRLQLWTGGYLVVFFIVHLSAVFVGRLILHLDTNFYFGVAGLNSFPYNIVFIPYYGLAIVSVFGHIAAVHNKKMKSDILSFTPKQQSFVILSFGVLLTVVIFYGLTNHFNGVRIPENYNILIGR